MATQCLGISTTSSFQSMAADGVLKVSGTATLMLSGTMGRWRIDA